MIEAIWMGWKTAVIQIALDARQRADHLGVAQAEADAPARHVVALRQREDLDGDFLGALHLQNAGRPVAVEAQVGVGEIVHHHGAVMARQADDLLEEIEVHALRRGIVRERNQDHRGGFVDRAVEVLQRLQETSPGPASGSMQAWPSAMMHAVLVDGVAGVGRNHGVARPDHGEQQMRQRVLGADGDDGFLFRDPASTS